MCAFCADSTCLASSGMAWLLISWSRRVSVGYRMAFTAVIFPAAMLTSTWTGPYLVASALPSTTNVSDAVQHHDRWSTARALLPRDLLRQAEHRRDPDPGADQQDVPAPGSGSRRCSA